MYVLLSGARTPSSMCFAARGRHHLRYRLKMPSSNHSKRKYRDWVTHYYIDVQYHIDGVQRQKHRWRAKGGAEVSFAHAPCIRFGISVVASICFTNPLLHLLPILHLCSSRLHLTLFQASPAIYIRLVAYAGSHVSLCTQRSLRSAVFCWQGLWLHVRTRMARPHKDCTGPSIG